LGTEHSHFFGDAGGSGRLLPFAILRFPVYTAQYQTVYSRVRLVFFEIATGKFVRSAPWFQASTFFYEYGTLFFIDFYATNLIGPLENQTPLGTNEGTATDV